MCDGDGDGVAFTLLSSLLSPLLPFCIPPLQPPFPYASFSLIQSLQSSLSLLLSLLSFSPLFYPRISSPSFPHTLSLASFPLQPFTPVVKEVKTACPLISKALSTHQLTCCPFTLCCTSNKSYV